MVFDNASYRAFAPRRHAIRPGDDTILIVLIAEIFFRNRDPAAHRNARRVHGVGIAGHQRMPPIKVVALRHQSVTACRRQPSEATNIVGRQPHAIVDSLAAIVIVLASAGGVVEQATADVRVINPPGVQVFELVETAAPATVAQALPFGHSQLCKGLAAPERHIGHRSTPDQFEDTAATRPTVPGRNDGCARAIMAECGHRLSTSRAFSSGSQTGKGDFAAPLPHNYSYCNISILALMSVLG